jgi:hypothetical protein
MKLGISTIITDERIRPDVLAPKPCLRALVVLLGTALGGGGGSDAANCRMSSFLPANRRIHLMNHGPVDNHSNLWDQTRWCTG